VTIETEIKIRVADLETFRDRLKQHGSRLLSGRHFEDNYVLDYADGRLRSQACLLRVRKTKDRESVTFKGPPQASILFKRREELETQVENADIMLRIFERMDMKVWFRYQKYREEFLFAAADRQVRDLVLALDATPIGNYAELEGSEEDIRRVAGALGFGDADFLRDSYYALYADFCRQRGCEPQHMVFSAPEGGGSASS
jgi:adenylate cyclase, class 2